MVHSDKQTTCSSDKNDSLSSVIRNDAVRYRRKGYGLVAAFAISISYFYFFPEILQLFWNGYVSLASEKTLYVFTLLLLNIGVLLIANLFMVAIYKLKLPFFQNYRISNKPWPWEQNSEKWNNTLRTTLKSILFNVVVLELALLYLDTTSHFEIKFSAEELPNKLTHIWQIMVFMVAEDFFFYLAHSTLHRPTFYWIHKKHHQFNLTVSIAAEYCHPIQFVLANAIPTGIGFRLLSLLTPVHMSTVIMWIFLRVCETTDGHCGYEWSWSMFRLLPMSGSAEYHNFHHSHNIGNYGSFFSIWDTVFGTNKYYFEYKSKKEREEYLNQLRKEYEMNKKKDRVAILEDDDQ